MCFVLSGSDVESKVMHMQNGNECSEEGSAHQTGRGLGTSSPGWWGGLHGLCQAAPEAGGEQGPTGEMVLSQVLNPSSQRLSFVGYFVQEMLQALPQWVCFNKGCYLGKSLGEACRAGLQTALAYLALLW